MTAFQYGNEDNHIGWDSDKGPNSQNFLWFNPSRKFDFKIYRQMIFLLYRFSERHYCDQNEEISQHNWDQVVDQKNSRNENVFEKYG